MLTLRSWYQALERFINWTGSRWNGFLQNVVNSTMLWNRVKNKSPLQSYTRLCSLRELLSKWTCEGARGQGKLQLGTEMKVRLPWLLASNWSGFLVHRCLEQSFIVVSRFLVLVDFVGLTGSVEGNRLVYTELLGILQQLCCWCLSGSVQEYS